MIRFVKYFKPTFINISNPKHLLYAKYQGNHFWEVAIPKNYSKSTQRTIFRTLGLKQRNQGFTLRVKETDNWDFLVQRREAYSKEWVTVVHLERTLPY